MQNIENNVTEKLLKTDNCCKTDIKLLRNFYNTVKDCDKTVTKL